MAKLGDLFIELGVVGNIKEMENALTQMKRQAALTQTQIKLDNARAKALEKIRQATTKADKQRIAKAYNTEKKGIMEDAKVSDLSDKLKEKKSNLKGTAFNLLAFTAAVTSAVTVIHNLTNALIQSNQAFLDLTRTSDISLDTYQKWDGVGRMYGVKNAAQQIENLNERLFELKLTGQGARGFQLAGIDPRGLDADGVMEKLRDRVSTMDDTSASYLLKEMGLDPKMLHMLRISREEFNALNSEMQKFQLTQEQRQSIQGMNVEIEVASQKLQNLKDQAILAIMPYWVDFVNATAKLATVGAKVVKWITKSNSIWAKFTKLVIISSVALIGFGIAAKGVTLAINGISLAVGVLRGAITLLTSHPIILAITALIMLLMILVDDIVGYNNGKDSLIGTIINALDDLDVKGFIDFPVPKWLEYFIDVINFLRGGGKAQLAEFGRRYLQDALDDENVTTIKRADGTYAYADVPPEFRGLYTGGASSFDNVNLENLLNEDDIVKGLINEAKQEQQGYIGTLPSLEHRRIISPVAEQAINNNSIENKTNSSTITQNNYIQTNQPANDIEKDLKFVIATNLAT